MGAYSQTLPFDIIILLYLFTVLLCIIQILRIFCDLPHRFRALERRNIPSDDAPEGSYPKKRKMDWYDPILFGYFELIVVCLIRAALVSNFRYPEYTVWWGQYGVPILTTAAHLVTYWLSTTTTIHWLSVCEPDVRDEVWLKGERKDNSMFLIVKFFFGVFNILVLGICVVYCITLIDDTIIPYPLYLGQLFYLIFAFLYLLTYVLFVAYAVALLPDPHQGRRNQREYRIVHVLFTLGFLSYLFYTAEKISWLLALAPLDLGSILTKALPSDVTPVLAYQYLALCFHLASGFLIWAILNRGVSVGAKSKNREAGDEEREGFKAQEGHPNHNENENEGGMNGYHRQPEIEMTAADNAGGPLLENKGAEYKADSGSNLVQAAMFSTPLRPGEEAARDSPVKGVANRRDTVGTGRKNGSLEDNGEVVVHTPARFGKNEQKTKSPTGKTAILAKKGKKEEEEELPLPPPDTGEEMKFNRRGFEKERTSTVTRDRDRDALSKLKSPNIGGSDAELQPGLPQLPGVPSPNNYLPAVTPVSKPKNAGGGGSRKPAFDVPESPELPPPPLPSNLSPPESPADNKPKVQEIRRTQPLPVQNVEEVKALRRGDTPQPIVAAPVRAPTPAKSKTATAPIPSVSLPASPSSLPPHQSQISSPTPAQPSFQYAPSPSIPASSSSISHTSPGPLFQTHAAQPSPMFQHLPASSSSRPSEEKRETKQVDAFQTPTTGFRRPVISDQRESQLTAATTRGRPDSVNNSNRGGGGGRPESANRGRPDSVASNATGTFRDDDVETRSVVDSETEVPGMGMHEESPESMEDPPDGRLPFPHRTSVGSRDVMVHDDTPEWDLYTDPLHEHSPATPPLFQDRATHAPSYSQASSSSSSTGTIRNSSRGLQLPPLPAPPIEQTDIALDFPSSTIGHRVRVVGDPGDYPDDDEALDDLDS